MYQELGDGKGLDETLAPHPHKNDHEDSDIDDDSAMSAAPEDDAARDGDQDESREQDGELDADLAEPLSSDSDNSDLEAERDGHSSSSDSEDDGEVKAPGRPALIDTFANELFPGSPYTVQEAADLLFLFQRRFKTSDESMIVLFDLVKLLLPDGNDLLRFQQLKVLLADSRLTDVVCFDACVNDCVIYRDAPIEFDLKRERQWANLNQCPVCNEPRRDQRNSPRKVPFLAGVCADKVLRCFDIFQSCHSYDKF